jgi:hypothetical protein
MSKPTQKPLDARLIERNIRQGILSRREIQKQRDALPDVSHKAMRLGDIERAGRTSDE